MLNQIYSWLAREDPIEKADLLFVLAGVQARQEYAVKLFQEGWSPQILFSVGRFELRRFPKLGLSGSPDLVALAKEISPPRRHYFVLLRDGQFEVKRIPVRWLGTLSEIDALADWLAARPGISSVLVISSGSHLRRLRLCCGVLLPRHLQIRFRAVPRENAKETESDSERIPRTPPRQRIRRAPHGTSLELLKLFCYALFLPLWRVIRRWRTQTIHSLQD